ncbi:MAG: sigma-54-dependent Fis family transcriptional regulator [Planctomycetota bacterium]|nr:MAG: sigma-54-dependent Fis family transcriptional regulator [Planctomycetota bacterium]
MTSVAEPDPFLEHFLPGSTPAMKRLRSTIALVNRRYKNPPRMGRSILLVGETGVGKNRIARVVAGHLYWLRDPGIWQPPQTGGRARTLLQVTAEHFVVVPLPNLPTQLIETELFGHVKGAFTDAVADREGYFGADYIEDLLLDEIGEAEPVLQAKLLQVLNDGTFKRIGAPPSESRSTEARIFLATNRDLAAEVRRGRFRADLYWRVQQLVIRIPPLREQRDGIPVLAESVVADILRANAVSVTEMRLQPADLDWAKRQPWPGNVRELERLLWRWVYEEGKRPLREIQKEYPEESLGAEAGDASVRTVLRSRVLSALEKGEQLAGSVGEFARGVESEVQLGLYELKNELGLERRALSTLFGDGDRAAKQISAWGEKARSK